LLFFKDDNRPFKVVATILKTLDIKPHGNYQKKKRKKAMILERHLMYITVLKIS
jgi:hypothetical protein